MILPREDSDSNDDINVLVFEDINNEDVSNDEVVTGDIRQTNSKKGRED